MFERQFEATELMEVPEKLDKGSAAWEQWREYREALIMSHRHEDGLLNTRLTGFLTATAFLMTMFALFSNQGANMFAAMIVLILGIAFSAQAIDFLPRTSKVIEWHIDAIMRIEKALWPQENEVPFRLYRYRRERMNDFDRNHGMGRENDGKPVPVSMLLSLIPATVFVGWLSLAISIVQWSWLQLPFWLKP